jgi:nicotinamide phosphoribosyltransferase
VKTSDIPVDVLMNLVIKFALHDFGGRGVSSTESAVLGGMSHLVNFWGSDTVEGILGAYAYYDADITSLDAPPVARTIPASEHSTVTSWGRANEVEAYRNMVTQFSFAGSIYACVSDSYNIYEAVRELWGNQLKDLVIDSGGTLVVRPDSGDPMTVPIEIMDILAECFGYTVNSKGYKVLAKRPDGSPIVKVIQGDGLNEHTLQVLVDNIIAAGYSLENIAFGMGGGLLQAWNRDTLKYAMKASAIRIADGPWVGFSKDPVGDHGKKSKEGRLALVRQCGLGSCGYRTLPEEMVTPEDNLLKLVYLNGELFNKSTFEQVRERSELKPAEYEDVIVDRY